MIEIRINKEIGNYEPKFIASFTIRQTICIVLALPVCYLIYTSFSPIITADLAGFLCMLPAAVAFFFGWRKPYGMPTEKFIQSIFITSIIAPANRRYKTENRQEKLLNILYSQEDEDAGSNKKKKKNSKTKKQRYKVSSKAVK